MKIILFILLLFLSVTINAQNYGYYMVTKNYHTGELNIIKTVDYDDVQTAYKNLTNWELEYSKITTHYCEDNDNWYFYIQKKKVIYKYDKIIYKNLNKKDLKKLKQ